MEVILCLILGVWTLISGIAVTYRVFKDFEQADDAKGNGKKL